MNLLTLALTLSFPFGALAGDPPGDDLVESMTYHNVQVTHYSATPKGGRPCKYECDSRGRCVGGADESPSGVRPLSAIIEKPGTIKGRKAVLAAVPQKKGTRGLYGCFFALPDAYPGTLFFGGDFYGSQSNGLKKVDVSSACTTRVNSTLKSKAVVYNCPGTKGGAGTPIARPSKPKPEQAREPAEEVAAKPNPAPDSNACYYGVFTCDRTMEEANEERSRLGSDLQVINTSTVPGFGSGWYCVSTGPTERGIASARVQQLKRKAPSGYVKKGC